MARGHSERDRLCLLEPWEELSMKHMFGAVSAAALAVSMALPAVAEDGLKIGMTFQEMNNPYFLQQV